MRVNYQRVKGGVIDAGQIRIMNFRMPKLIGNQFESTQAGYVCNRNILAMDLD